ncbi:AMP-binding protein [Thermomonospora umbrina]|nr:AMP-binding protein [Thermomonospora umbrina]
MQDVPLEIRRLLRHGTQRHASATIDTATRGGFRRVSFAETGVNVARLAHALRGLGVGEGDRVGTFMGDNAEHVEAFFAVPCLGAVLHPIDVRRPGDEIAFVVDHAEDRVVIVDGALLPVFEPLLPALKTVEHVIVNGPGVPGLTAPAGVTFHEYAALLGGHPATYDWPETGERRAAALCYASDGTGEPKGVVHDHRSISLRAMTSAMPGVLGLSEYDRLLVAVPQFEEPAWGLPYAAFLTGASLALPDRFREPAALAAFTAASRPNLAVGTSDVWEGLLPHLEMLSSLTEAAVGGVSCAPSLMDAYDEHGITLVPVFHRWGAMAVARPPVTAFGDEIRGYRLTQGRFVGPVEARLVAPDGSVLPHDGESVGELEVRGPWIAGSYYRAEDPGRFRDGWLRTGDVGHIGPDGYLTLTRAARH